jgi:hypothetical protein
MAAHLLLGDGFSNTQPYTSMEDVAGLTPPALAQVICTHTTPHTPRTQSRSIFAVWYLILISSLRKQMHQQWTECDSLCLCPNGC